MFIHIFTHKCIYTCLNVKVQWFLAVASYQHYVRKLKNASPLLII